MEVAPDAFIWRATCRQRRIAPAVSMRARQQLLRTSITDIVVDVDDEVHDVVLTTH
jgi:hypothetical protein